MPPAKKNTHNAFATLRFQKPSIGSQWESNWGNSKEIAKCLINATLDTQEPDYLIWMKMKKVPGSRLLYQKSR